MSNPLPIVLSVVIPVYNVSSYIERCVRSLMEQTTHEGVEYIFVEDCSTDDSFVVLQRVLREYQSLYLPVTIIRTPHNSGLAVARSLGVQNSNGEYITNCDSDDWVAPNRNEYILKIIQERHPDIIVSDFLLYRNDSVESHIYPDLDVRERLRHGHDWMQWSHVVKSKIIQEHHIMTVSGLDFWEDMDFLMRVYHFAESIFYIHHPLYYYDCTRSMTLSELRSDDVAIRKCRLVIEHLSDFYHQCNQAPPPRLWALQKYCRDLYLMRVPTDWTAWQSLYPDCWRYVWMDRDFNFFYRIAYTLSSLGCFFSFRLYLYFSRQLSK